MEKKERKKLGLTSKIFIALIAGAILGIIINKFSTSEFISEYIVEGVFYVIGQGFIRGMQMLVVPLVFASLVTGSMSMGDTTKLGKIGIKTMAFYLVTTALAIAIALGVANIINPGLNLNLPLPEAGTGEVVESMDMRETILNIIPTNPISAMANGEMLQIIIFALIVGVILAKLGEKAKGFANIMVELNDIMMEMTMFVMKFAPIGVFALITRTFSNIGLDAITPIFKYMISVVTGLGVQLFLVYLVLLFILARVNPFKFLRKFAPVMGFAFSTASSNATIPLNINKLEEMGVSKKVSSFTIPLGATINMDGTAIMQGVAVVFMAQAYGINLTIADYGTVILAATLASVGTAGIPSVGLVTLTMVLSSVGLPTEGIALIMGIDRILDMARTAINITGDAVCSTVIAKQEGLLNLDRFNL
ncbi:dicarboxylate/amino acid:cation symporter [Miniphocaeibacter halophilus]|uniref:Dicarboxylate/amino acid:cation symporter n=1 Tax=Miniphocaeibacter halophilus TaxID=2931922 RepID=A0AC61MT86_9FIRM|nr:dicarboxylate/amino acid:cation symporter [Miniphocaeibacter halophilus]QQK08563.1 dicarboxylate/amino acid:cation symporter [Miniphocaeibacter halophilus]